MCRVSVLVRTVNSSLQTCLASVLRGGGVEGVGVSRRLSSHGPLYDDDVNFHPLFM